MFKNASECLNPPTHSKPVKTIVCKFCNCKCFWKKKKLMNGVKKWRLYEFATLQAHDCTIFESLNRSSKIPNSIPSSDLEREKILNSFPKSKIKKLRPVLDPPTSGKTRFHFKDVSKSDHVKFILEDVLSKERFRRHELYRKVNS